MFFQSMRYHHYNRLNMRDIDDLQWVVPKIIARNQCSVWSCQQLWIGFRIYWKNSQRKNSVLPFTVKVVQDFTKMVNAIFCKELKRNGKMPICHLILLSWVIPSHYKLFCTFPKVWGILSTVIWPLDHLEVKGVPIEWLSDTNWCHLQPCHWDNVTAHQPHRDAWGDCTCLGHREGHSPVLGQWHHEVKGVVEGQDQGS